MQDECHWICLFGTSWYKDPTFPNTCPEGQECLPPTQRGASGDKTTTPCTSDTL